MAANRNIWPTIGKLVAALVACGVLTAGLLLPYVGGVGLFAGHEAGKFLDQPCTTQPSPPPQKTVLYARDGKTVIATIFKQDRVPIDLSGVPQYLQDALIATEDRRFYQHHGVDLRGLIRGAISTSNGDTQGGSTLTMQYVKQLRYYQAGDDVKKQQAAIQQTLDRKIEDAKCAVYFERTLKMTKRQILQNYLNIAFFGENSFGIETAAETYFHKHARNLTLPESALLVGLLRAPTAYDPFLDPVAAKQRRNEVLDNLVAVHKLSAARAERLKATPVVLATSSPPQVRQGCANSSSKIANAAFFCEYVVNWLENVDGISESLLETGGLHIVTTLDPRLQNAMQAAIQKQVPATSPMTAVMPAVDPRTGDVLAMAASKTYGSKRGQTEQQIFTGYIAHGASTYKLFPLLAALSTGFPADWQMQTATNTGSYTTRNCYRTSTARNGDSGESYNQNESLTSATAKSSNTFFVGLLDVGMGCDVTPAVNIALQLGMNGLNQPSEDDPKTTWAKDIETQQLAQLFTLGDISTSPLELAGAYAAIANNGKFNAPAPVLTVTDSTSQNQLPVKRSAGVQVVSPQVAQAAVQILQGDTKGVGTSASEFASNWYGAGLGDVAGKTGTVVAVNPRNGKETDKNAAIWFVGMTPTVTAATAVVNLDHPNWASRGLPGEGTGTAYGGYAASVWIAGLKNYLSGTWSWPSYVPGSTVPDVTGLEPAEAKAKLAADGFKMQLLPGGGVCASSELSGTVAFYGPSVAQRGDTITVCLSSGATQPVWIAPPPPPPVHHGPTQGHTPSPTTHTTPPATTQPSPPPHRRGHG